MTAETATPEFLTVRELADLLRIKERKVYDIAASGDLPCSRVTGKLLFPEAAVRAWIARGSSGGAPHPARPAVFLGSHDPLLDWAIRQSRSGLATLFDGSLDGLARFRAREGVATGLHIHDARSGSWNVAAVAAECAGENAVLVGWATRRRGLVLPRGRDRHQRAARPRGSACRPAAAGIRARRRCSSRSAQTPEWLRRRSTSRRPARSENDAVLAIAAHKADASFGLEALARPYNLRFVPVVEEHFDLLVDRRAWFEPPMHRLLDFASTAEFRAHAATLDGYDVSALGEVRWNA